MKSADGGISLEQTVDPSGLRVADVKALVRQATGTPDAQQRLTIAGTRRLKQHHFSSLAEQDPLMLSVTPGTSTIDLDLAYSSIGQEQWLQKVRANPHSLDRAPTWVCADREIVLTACRLSGVVLRHASAELKADAALVLEAVAQAGGAMLHASESLRSDTAFVMRAVALNVGSLSCAAPAVLGDREFLLDAVALRAGALGALGDEARSDKGFVVAAMSRNGAALCHASEDVVAWASRSL